MTQQDTFITSTLRQPGAVVLPGNRPYIEDLAGAGGRVQRYESGHLVFYGALNRRILMTDPDGNPLHECEWSQAPDGQTRLTAARLHLEWGQWVGIKPEGLVNQTFLDLSTRPGWESISRDDLRFMASRVMNVSLDHIRFFYTDEDLEIGQSGQATIRQRKDAFYVLPDGRFEGAKFMSCMSAMHWGKIDFLPVVELFLSLLPGTGSAAFELIRGLYDDQNPLSPLPLRYRGIPVYPSQGAFRLFSQFFAASVQGSRDPLSVFLDPAHSGEVAWTPCPDPPLRYFDPRNHLCVTVRKGEVQKSTRGDDASGLSYFPPNAEGLAPYGRAVTVKDTLMVLQDGITQTDFPIKPAWGITSPSGLGKPVKDFGSWRHLFPDGPPNLKPVQAFSTTLLYPIDEREIGEPESQPFVLDYWDDLIDENPQIHGQVSSAHHMLISQCDAALASCIRLDCQRTYTILYTSPQFAQKQAQNLWNQFAHTQRLDWIPSIRFLDYSQHLMACVQQQYNVMYVWVPFTLYQEPLTINQTLSSLTKALLPGGLAFVAGPSQVAEFLNTQNLDILYGEPAHSLPTFQLHRSILPQAQLNRELMMFVSRKQAGRS